MARTTTYFGLNDCCGEPCGRFLSESLHSLAVHVLKDWEYSGCGTIDKVVSIPREREPEKIFDETYHEFPVTDAEITAFQRSLAGARESHPYNL